MDWYYAESGRQVGPVAEDSFNALVRSGVVRADTLVWQQGMANWQTYASVRPVPVPVAAVPLPDAASAVTPGPATRFCSECGRPFPQGELIPFGNSFVCAACKETFAHKLREGVGVAGAPRYAGFWIRFVAKLIDGAILFTVSMILSTLGGLVFFSGGVLRGGGASVALTGAYLAFQGVLFLINMAIAISYEVYFLTRYNATPGKLALRLKIIPVAGGPISLSLAVGRYFANYLSVLTLGIGYIMAGLDEQKRALHDRICETRVIHA